MLSTTEEKLQEVFTQATGREGVLERVKKLRDYAFIHFITREDALKAMEVVNGTRIDDALVEVVLAKPVDKTEHNNQRVLAAKGATQARLLFDLLPGVELTPINPLTLRPQPMKSPVQLLQDLCQKNSWGSPVYQLHSAIQKDAFRETSAQFFLYKVSIPALPNHQITPNKLCRTLEEARIFAAEYTLKSLGIPVESSEITVPHQITTSTAAYQGRPLAPTISIAREVQVPISYATPYVVPSKCRF
ncbi:APOBEC1 complementation factor [Elysia marginata]|uniref:APOBEC1 complementation factor n=1 Tax=Elysia marginata TaxID=1093978 RepID=A0AAV4G452_9GAST|nr:APOBEC1 complementation factor [Elysia marginata]